MSVVKEYYLDFVLGNNSCPWWDEVIYEHAKKNPVEKKVLIELFENEKDQDNKYLLACILAELNDSYIIPYLLEIIEKDKDLSQKAWAAAKLTQVHYEKSLTIILNLINSSLVEKRDLAWELFQISFPFSKHILNTLLEIDNEIKNLVIEFESYAKKLKQ